MKLTNQEIESLKKVSCVDYLLSRGHKPKHSTGRTYKFLAPWRPESSSSLSIYKATNTFVDFGDKTKAGSVIQLVMALEDVSFPRALEILQGNKLPEHKIEHFAIPKEAIRIIYRTSITDDRLIQYLAKRCIPLIVANRYCQEACIELHNSKGEAYTVRCIAFINSKGGYEFRSTKLKISNSPKIYSTINPGNATAIVVEGFFDLLSYFTLYGEQKDITYISLNSTSFVDYCDWHNFSLVEYWGDRDTAGNKCLQKIKEKIMVKDMRLTYNGFKDLNEYLVYKNSPHKTLYQVELNKLLNIPDKVC